jgi:hypothetical protein
MISKFGLTAAAIFSFSIGVIFSIFGSYSLYFFLYYLAIEIILLWWNKGMNIQERVIIVGSSIIGYIIGRALIEQSLFVDM